MRRRRNQNTVYKFKQVNQYNQLVITTSGISAGHGITFALQDLPGYERFVAMFQQYAISYVKLTIIPTSNINNDPTTSRPMVYACVDYDDNLTPETPEELLNKQGVKVLYGTRPFTIKLRPRVLGMVYESLSTTGYSPRKHTWISTRDPSVPHYGVKLFFTTPPVTNYYNMHATFYLKFKGLSSSWDS